MKKAELKRTMSFELVRLFSKKLTLHFWQNDQTKENISFPHHPYKAMQFEIKQSIKKKFKVAKGTIPVKSITATATMTVGALNVDHFDKVNFALGGIQLIANGIPSELIGGGSQSSLRGRQFDIRYDALPEQLDSLELVMREFVGYQIIEENISLASMNDEPITLDGKELWVKDVSTTSQGVEITIPTDDDVMLDGVAIETQTELTSLKTTVNQINTKQEDGRVMKERTLLFDTMAAPEYLLIEGIHYMKPYNHVIEIPVD